MSASTRIIDLNDLVVPDRKVQLGERIYTVPGDMPMEIFLKVDRAGQIEEKDGEAAALEAMRDAIVSLLCWNTPELDLEKVNDEANEALAKFGVRGITGVLRAIYQQDDEAEVEPAEDEPDPPKPARKAGTTK